MKTLTKLESGAARVALTRMIDPTRYFDITAFDNLCTVVGVSCDGQTRHALRLLHCVNCRDMDTTTRMEAVRAIITTFNADADIVAMGEQIMADEEPKPKPRGVLAFLRGAA